MAPKGKSGGGGASAGVAGVTIAGGGKNHEAFARMNFLYHASHLFGARANANANATPTATAASASSNSSSSSSASTSANDTAVTGSTPALASASDGGGGGGDARRRTRQGRGTRAGAGAGSSGGDASASDGGSGSGSGDMRSLSRYYAHHMRSIAQRLVIRIGVEVKHTICKRCNTLLLPGQTSTVRIEDDTKRAESGGGGGGGSELSQSIACRACGAVRRTKLKRTQSAFRGAAVEPTDTLQTELATNSTTANPSSAVAAVTVSSSAAASASTSTSTTTTAVSNRERKRQKTNPKTSNISFKSTAST